MGRDLLTPPPATKVGESNARFLAYLSLGETREQLLERYRSGELPNLNLGYAKAWLAEAGR